MTEPTKILLQTTIPTTEDDWSIARFSREIRSAVKAGWSVSPITSLRTAGRPSVALRRLHREKGTWIGSKAPQRLPISGKVPRSLSKSSAKHLSNEDSCSSHPGDCSNHGETKCHCWVEET